jgi:hypothetical protein
MATAAAAVQRKQKRQAPTKPMQPPLIPADSALVRLARRLSVFQGIPTNPPPDALPLILEALLTDGWRPPRYRVLSKKASGQLIRRALVFVILDNAPPEYQRPRSTRTLEWVKEQVPRLSPLLAEQFPSSDDTLQKDIEDWAYNPETGRQRKQRRVKAAEPPTKKSNVKRVKPHRKTKGSR